MIHTDHIRTDSAYDGRLERCGLRTVSEILSRIGDRVAAWSRTTDTIYVRTENGQPGFYVKRYAYPRWQNRLRGMFRGTFLGVHRGQAEFRALHTMCRLGISGVRPVAHGSRRIGHFINSCFLITEEVPEARNLTSFAREVADGTMRISNQQRTAISRLLADQVSRMHAAGFVHGKMFWRNILVRIHADGEPEFFFLDARPPARMKRLSSNAACRREELAHLAASAMPFTTRADRLRFACKYYGTKRLSPELRGELAEIERLAARFRRHETQRIKMNDLFDLWNRVLDKQEQDKPAGTAKLPLPEPV